MGPVPTRRLLTPPLVLTVLANATPLVGVMFLGWDVLPLVASFWIESVVIGAVKSLRIMRASRAAGRELKTGLTFLLHYGAFCVAHGAVILVMFADAWIQRPAAFTADVILPFVRQHHLGWAAAGLLASHLLAFWWEHVAEEEYEAVKQDAVAAHPYGRTLVLHLVLLTGAALIVESDLPVEAAGLLVLLKGAVEFRIHRRAARR